MKKILCVIDYQVDFVTGVLGSEATSSIAPALVDKIHLYRENGWEVVFTRDVHTHEDYGNTCEGRHIPIEHCIRGTSGFEIDPSVRVLSQGCRIFDKSSFGSYELAEYLRDGDYDSVEIAGVVTDICVLSNAVLARTVLPSASVIVDRSCVAAGSDDKQEAALSVLSSICVDVV